MRLAVFTSKYPARVATFFERDMRALIEAGVDVEIFPIHPLDADLWRYSLDILNADVLPRQKVHHLSLPDAIGRRRSSATGRGGSILRETLAVLSSAIRYGPVPLAKTAYVLPKAWAWAAEHAGRFDHVLAYWGNYAGTCAYVFHRLIGRPIPFSIWLHAGTDLYRTPVYMRQKLTYADNIITCCEFNRAFMLKQFRAIGRVIGPKIHVCHHGLDLDDFAYRPEGRPGHRVVAVGRLAAHKGFDYLLRAISLLAHQGSAVTLDLVGDGAEREALSALADELQIVDRVGFRGWLSFPEARRAMTEATLLVHPSDGLGDGLPNVIREAMAVGTPVIASDVAGIPDALGDGCGVLVPPKDPVLLADAIRELLEHPDRRQRFATAARTRVEERFDLWRNGARLAALLGATRRHGGVPNRQTRPLPRVATC